MKFVDIRPLLLIGKQPRLRFCSLPALFFSVFQVDSSSYVLLCCIWLFLKSFFFLFLIKKICWYLAFQSLVMIFFLIMFFGNDMLSFAYVNLATEFVLLCLLIHMTKLCLLIHLTKLCFRVSATLSTWVDHIIVLMMVVKYISFIYILLLIS